MRIILSWAYNDILNVERKFQYRQAQNDRNMKLKLRTLSGRIKMADYFKNALKARFSMSLVQLAETEKTA
jgi:hypothetical protein